MVWDQPRSSWTRPDPERIAKTYQAQMPSRLVFGDPEALYVLRQWRAALAEAEVLTAPQDERKYYRVIYTVEREKTVLASSADEAEEIVTDEELGEVVEIVSCEWDRWATRQYLS